MKHYILKITAPLAALVVNLSILCAVAPISRAAYVYYTFDSTIDGNGSFTLAPTGNSGFASASSVSHVGTKPSETGGASSYTAPDDTIWLGGGGAGVPGHSIGWGDPSTGNSFSVTLDTTGLQDLTVRLDVRAANSGSGLLKTFDSLTYRIGDGAPVDIIVPLSFTTGGNAFYEWTADLSSVSALNNQPEVTLTWKVGSLVGVGSLRIDNLEIRATPIPEASSAGVLIVTGILVASLFVRRRRF